jgi:hypothetical protein
MNSETELLVLPDGRVLVHNLTPAMAALLSGLAPNDQLMRRRAALSRGSCTGPVSIQGPPETQDREPNHP